MDEAEIKPKVMLEEMTNDVNFFSLCQLNVRAIWHLESMGHVGKQTPCPTPDSFRKGYHKEV